MEWKQSPRPCYDMVEEYNRSLDEYKDKVRRTNTEKIYALGLVAETTSKRQLVPHPSSFFIAHASECAALHACRLSSCFWRRDG